MEFFDGLRGAFDDLRNGARLAPLWWKLALEQTIARYRRTVLGPFWLASSTVATGIGLSLIFGTIFGGDWKGNFPFIMSGVVTFQFASGVLGEGANTFLAASPLMQVRNLPLSFHSFLMCNKIIINFAHQIVAFWLVTAVLRLIPLPHWEFIFTLPLDLAIGFAWSFPLGMIATRYRDVSYFIGFVLTTMFMLTPVFWRQSQIPPKLHWIVEYNPLAHMLEVLRQPLLGHPAPMADLSASIFIFLIGSLLAICSLAIYRRRIVFWL